MMRGGVCANSFGVCDEKSCGFCRFGNCFEWMLQSQPEQESIPELAVEPEKVDLQKLVDQFDISAAFD